MTDLLVFSDFVTNCLKYNSQVVFIYIDFTKAFNVVNINRLIQKLNNMGIQGSVLSWIESYITNRKQAVRVKGVVSDPHDKTAGLPQGFHLGPVLFLIYINDLPEFLKFSNYLLFIDDIKLYH